VAESSKQPFEVNDFSLGITDDPFEKDPRYSIELDNYNLRPDGSLVSRDGSLVEVPGTPQIPSGEKRIGALINYDNDSNLLVQSERNIYYRNPTTYTTLVGPVDSNPVFSAAAETNNASFSEWNKQVFITHDTFPRPMKIYKDSGGTMRVNTSGLPALASTPTGTPTAGSNAYLYSFHYLYEYTVGSQTFQDVGPITQLTVGSAAAPDSNQIDIAVIPAIANGATDNWDTANIKVQIYRTIAAGTTFYYVGQVTNGTATYTDNSSDATIQNNVLMYTEDGTLEYTPVPLHKYVHIVNGIGYYGHVKAGAVEFPFRIRQSIPGNPSGCPADFFIDVEDTVRGIGSVVSLPIVFCNRHVYRLDNNFDQFGRGGITPVRISDTAGCVSSLSIVSAEGKIFWAGTDGFYSTDGYKVQKISDKLNARYKLLLAQADDQNRIYGKFDEENRRIVWAIQQNSSSAENDSMIVLDLRWGVRPASTFTTYSGATFRPSSIEFFKGKMYRADDNGYVIYHISTIPTDPQINVNADATDWEFETIIWNYKSLNYNFGSSFFRKKPTRILITARNVGNTSIQINSIDDDGKRTRALKPIRWRRNFVWGDANFVWGNPDFIWRSLGLIEQWRRFPARGLRLSYCQIQITNAYSVTASSDLLGDALFDGGANTATLTNDWPDDAVDYFISTEVDGYVKEYKISARTTNVLTVIDAAGGFPSGTYSWLIKGYRKGEPLNLQGYVVHIASEDQMQLTYESGGDGTNA